MRSHIFCTHAAHDYTPECICICVQICRSTHVRMSTNMYERTIFQFGIYFPFSLVRLHEASTFDLCANLSGKFRLVDVARVQGYR